jgi:hypothetical protein
MKLAVAPFVLLLLSTCIAGESPAARVPVLLELFTSEGCSSCPPADALLQDFDSRQPIAGAELIVLSEHVDYWNYLGWKDPFSSAVFSDRQRGYARSLGGDVYTPEMVVDGAKGFVGSDEGDARRAVKEAVRVAKTPIRVDVQRVDGKTKISLHMDRSVEGSLYLALAHEVMKSQVTRGENSGRGLSHVAVVYSIEKVAKIDGRDSTFDREITISPRAGEPTRVVAFVEKSEMGRVLALGQARL